MKGKMIKIAAAALLIMNTASLLWGQTLQCRIVVGPTPDTLLTKAHQDLTQEVARRLQLRNISCRVEFVDAWERANKMFQNREADVLFAEIVGDTEQGGLTGIPTGRTEGFVIFTKKGDPSYNRLEDLQGKVVGIIRGRFYPPTLTENKAITIERVNSLEQNFRKVLSGRIDATIEYWGDGVQVLEKMEAMDAMQYGEEFEQSYLAYRFHNSPSGIQLMEALNIVIAEIITDGTYEQIFALVPRRMLYQH